jgi:hypothetical protein
MLFQRAPFVAVAIKNHANANTQPPRQAPFGALKQAKTRQERGVKRR